MHSLLHQNLAVELQRERLTVAASRPSRPAAEPRVRKRRPWARESRRAETPAAYPRPASTPARS